MNEEIVTDAAEMVQEWCPDSSPQSESSGIIIKDYHNCYNEEDLTSENDSEAEHPIVYYDKRMYVREDFRNMISQGIEIPTDNILWSKDVTKLLKIFKKSVEDFDLGDVIDDHVIDDEDVEREVVREVEVKEKKIIEVNDADDMTEMFAAR